MSSFLVMMPVLMLASVSVKFKGILKPEIRTAPRKASSKTEMIMVCYAVTQPVR